jgi:lysophospholipase L1-like esterase
MALPSAPLIVGAALSFACVVEESVPPAVNGGSGGASGSPSSTGGTAPMASGGTSAATGGNAGSETAGAGAGSAGSAGTRGDAGGGGGAPSLAGAAGGGAGGQGQGGVSGGGAGGTTVAPFSPCPTNGDFCKVLPLGDSITLGLGYAGGYRVKLFKNAQADAKHLTFVGSQRNGPDKVNGATFPQAHEGRTGYTIDRIRTDLLPMIANSAFNPAPHIVLLMVGMEDMSAGSAEDQLGAAQRVGPLLDELVRLAPKALIVLAKIIPLGATQAGSSNVKPFVDALPAIVQERVAAGKHVLLVDPGTSFPMTELADGIHPTERGYDVIGDVWYAGIHPFLL